MSRMKNDFDFVAGVHVGDQLYFNHYRLTIDFYTNSDVMQDHNIAVDRLNYFIQEIASRSIFVSETDYNAIIKYTNAEIPVLTVPAPGPFDPVVLAVVVTKMNAVLEDTLVISDAEIISSVGGFITYVWDAADDEDEIHDLVDEADDTKWWNAPGPRFSSYPEDTDVEEFEEDNTTLITWETLNLHWMEDREDDDDGSLEIIFTPDDGSKTDGKILKFTDFTKPKKK